ncbi:MAG: hypothetical protein IPN01_10770 [Deltaproteobacteria bacterium]|nr:hypothetical protein [Deltaproteobacteria bacterium]
MSKKTPVQTLAEDLQQGRLSRRNFVLQALGLGVSLSVVGSVLTACSGGEGGRRRRARAHPRRRSRRRHLREGAAHLHLVGLPG